MLIKLVHLKGIKSGEISLAFRQWNKPTVKKGSRIKTAIGLIEILNISQITSEDIKEKEARAAGYEDVTSLINSLPSKSEGSIYKVELCYYSEDPRLKIREQTSLSDLEFSNLKTKIQRLDTYSKSGPWTANVLTAIDKNPKLRAVDLAAVLGKEKEWLKPQVRKLKNLGLTISHEVGYSISPLGKYYLLESSKSN